MSWSSGPLLLVPYIGPFLLRVDLRFASLVGEIFVPVAAAVVATTLATQGRAIAAAAWTAASAIMVSNLDAERFAAFAHTPVYWPLLAALAWSAARQHWRAAALLCGLLIATRWSMIAIAPVVLIGAWCHGKETFRRASVLMSAGGAGPYLPFAIWDWPALQSSVARAMHTPASIDVVGVCGILARAGFQHLGIPLAVVTMAGVYAYAVQTVRRGHRTLPWIAATLFAFRAVTSGTTSADYIDVFVLIAFASFSETPSMTLRSAPQIWTVCLLVAALAVSAVGLTDMQRDLQIDVGTPDARTFLYAGFADDEEAGRSFAWVDGNRAEVLLPRRSRRDAEITIECEPNLPTPTAIQQMSVTLNGAVLGTMNLREGWQTVVVPAPSRAWLIGVNELTLSFSSAVSPLSLGLSADPRKLSVAFDRIGVRTK
jgi:hypothetical protein